MPRAHQKQHAGCGGSGRGTRLDASCRACKGTGLAVRAFEHYARRRGVQDASLLREEDIDAIVECYVTALYGNPITLVDDEEKRAAYVFTVLQHSVNRDHLYSVRALGGLPNVFSWLSGEEETHCPPGAEKEYEVEQP